MSIEISNNNISLPRFPYVYSEEYGQYLFLPITVTMTTRNHRPKIYRTVKMQIFFSYYVIFLYCSLILPSLKYQTQFIQ